MIFMGGSYGRRRACYVRTNETELTKLKFVKRDALILGFMVLAGVINYGMTSLFFINKGRKVNANYYIDKVLKPFLKKDIISII
jgi:hypothetical protein